MLAEVSAIAMEITDKCENMPHNFSIGKHLNFISKLWEQEIKQEMSEHSNNKRGSGCVALLKFRFYTFTPTPLKHAGVSAEAGH